MLFVHRLETLRIVKATATVISKHMPSIMWNSSLTNRSLAGPGGIEKRITKGILTMMTKTKATIKNSKMLPRDSEDRSLSRLGAQRMIKLTLKGWLHIWQRGMQSTSASQTAFKRHRRWHRSQSCFLVQMHASTNDVSPDDSASRLHMTQMSFARGIREISPVSGYGQMQEDSNCQTKTHAKQLNKRGHTVHSKTKGAGKTGTIDHRSCCRE